MISPALVPIVEGQSEVGGIRTLLDRIIYDRMQTTGISIARPFWSRRYKVVKQGEIERTVKQAIRDRGGSFDVRGLLVLLDADDDCPVELSASLCERAQTATNLPVSVVVANKTIECWLLGAKESLRVVTGIKADAVAPPNPESIRGPKGHLTANMDGNRRYTPTTDLPAFLAAMDIDVCMDRCRSFRKFVKDVEWLVRQIKAD